MGAILQLLEAIAEVVRGDNKGFWRSKGTMTEGQSEVEDHRYKRLSLRGYGLGNCVEPSRFKLRNTAVLQRVYIHKGTEHRPGRKW